MHVEIANPRWRGKRSRHSWSMYAISPHNPPLDQMFVKTNNKEHVLAPTSAVYSEAVNGVSPTEMAAFVCHRDEMLVR